MINNNPIYLLEALDPQKLLPNRVLQKISSNGLGFFDRLSNTMVGKAPFHLNGKSPEAIKSAYELALLRLENLKKTSPEVYEKLAGYYERGEMPKNPRAYKMLLDVICGKANMADRHLISKSGMYSFLNPKLNMNDIASIA